MRKIMFRFFVIMVIFSTSSFSTIEVCSQNAHKSLRINYYNKLDVPSPSWLKGVDQILINNSQYGFTQTPTDEMAQSFKPTKNTLTAIAIYLFKSGNPHEQTTLTIAIRENLDGQDLTNITIMAKDWKIQNQGTWVLFDFPDIQVTPEKTYYIHKKVSHGGLLEDNYLWYIALNNQYPRGEGWLKEINIFDWETIWEWFDFDPDFPDPDFCFITYYQEPKNKISFRPFIIFLENHLHQFPILRLLLIQPSIYSIKMREEEKKN